MARRRSFLPLFSLLLCVAAAWFYFTPHMALRGLQKAAESGDTQALNRYVDFPALRGSVKSEMQAAVKREISRDAGNPFAALGGAFTGMMIGPLVDAAVSPTGISLMATGRRPSGDGGDAKQGDESWRDEVDRDMAYEGLDRFVVRFRDRQSGEEQVALIMRRDGLQWRLAGVRFGRPAE